MVVIKLEYAALSMQCSDTSLCQSVSLSVPYLYFNHGAFLG